MLQQSLTFAQEEVLPRFNPRNYSVSREGWDVFARFKPNNVFRGVEIIDSRGAALGEFDRIEDRLLIEEKSAQGLGRIDPRTGQPALTAESWAQKHIYHKTVVRIENLEIAKGTRFTVGGTPNVPTLAEVQAIRNLEFRIQSATPAVRGAVESQLQSLRAKYPNWRFGAKFGE